MTHIHTWQSTTANGWRTCSGCKLVQRQINGQWQTVTPKQKRQEQDWHQAEWEMLNQAHPYDSSDHRKASADLRNYWR
jgi:hypothetical protein